MSATKQQVRSLLNRLPDDCTLEDVQYHLYVLQKLDRGMQQADAGEVVAHDDVVNMSKEWAGESSGQKRRSKTSRKSATTSRARLRAERRERDRSDHRNG